MKKQNVLGLILATSLAMTSLAGCMVPGMAGKGGPLTNTGAQQPATQQPGGQTAVKPGTQTGGQLGSQTSKPPAAPAEAKEGTAESLSDEKDMEAYDYMAGEADAGRTVMMVGAEPAGEGMVAITAVEDKGDKGGKRPEAGSTINIRGDVKVTFKGKLAETVRKKLTEREGKKAEKLKDRLEKLKGDRQKLHEKAKGGKWMPTDPADGTEFKAFDFSVQKNVKANGKEASFGRSVTMKRVRNIETKDLVSSHVKFSQSLPGGLTRTSERTKTLNEDGTYTVVFHSELTLPKGGKRVADWTKTIAVDGSVTGTGTITWTDAAGAVVKETKITLNGTEEDTGANAGGTVVDGDAPEAAEGTQAEATAAADVAATPETSATEVPAATEEAKATEEEAATGEV